MIDMELLEAIGTLMDKKLVANNEILRKEISANNEILRKEISANNEIFRKEMSANNEILRKEMSANSTVMQERIINQVNAIIETKVVPQIQLIAEQYGDILDRLTDTEKLQDVSSRVCVLEDVVKTHTRQIEEFKIAL